MMKGVMQMGTELTKEQYEDILKENARLKMLLETIAATANQVM